jgi:tripartite-type tricarboxylate transporter receptor subunit TctC
VVAVNQMHQAVDDGTVSLRVGGTAIFSQMPLLPHSALRFNPNDVFVPLAVLWEEPFFVATRADAPWRSFDELVSRASAPQARLSYGTTGVQTTGGLYFDHFARRRGLGLVQVPFKGMAEVITNLLGGHVDVGVVSYQQIKPHLDGKALRLLASTGAARSALEPDVPTMLERGHVDFGCTVWFGLFARKSVDPTQLARVQAALKAVLDDPTLRARLGGLGYGVLGFTGADAIRYVQQSNQLWQRILARPSGT